MFRPIENPTSSRKVKLEVCVDSVASCVAAHEGGADRLELCSNLIEGGTTPSTGMVLKCLHSVPIPIVVMIRPRGGDFLYSEDEIAVMESDIDIIKRTCKVAGFVTGALTSHGDVDTAVMRRLIQASKPLPVIFHRAIDVSCDPMKQLATLESLGVERVLTSGGHLTALNGSLTIKQMVHSGLKIQILAGAGVHEENVAELVKRTGVTEVHGSFRETTASNMDFRPEACIYMGAEKMNDRLTEFSLKQVSASRVTKLKFALADIN